MNYSKLSLLFWKYLHYRKYFWILTILEVIVPIMIVFFFCIVSSKDQISGESTVVKTGTIIYPIMAAEEFLVFTRQVNRILYSPQTSFTKKIMQLVNETLVLPEIEPVENEETIRKRFIGTDEEYKKLGEKQLGVHFMNIHDESVPDRLQYKIMSRLDRNNLFYIKHLIQEVYQGAIDKNQYKDTGFSGFQASIDAAFIRIKTNVSELYYKNKFFIQIFPQLSYAYESNNIISYMMQILKYVLLMVMILQSYPLINTIIEEKQSGIKELMKIVGLPESFVWISWFLNTLIFSAITISAITVILLTNFYGPNTSSLKYVDPMLLWLFLILVTMANIMFCFTFSAIFHKTTYAAIIFSLASFAVGGIVDFSEERRIHEFALILPPGAFASGFNRIQKFEKFAMRVSWKKLSTDEDRSPEPPLETIFLALLLEIPLYMFLAFYIHAINPGKFGVRKPPWFIFLIPYNYFHRKQIPNIEPSKDVDENHVESVPPHLEPSLILKDVRKKFRNINAVNGVNLTIYKNEIMALLGPNGAGKTTLMSILTGLTNATSGSIVYDKKLNVLKNMSKFRHHIGFCPQEDRLFPYLSVRNHLLFFGMLKGQKLATVKVEADKFIKEADLMGMENYPVANISGGMKRKVCLGISLVGKSEILILDEPTSGIDVQSRRKLWNMLMVLRRNRTIILTTHHLEEADVLGDRIAIMTKGIVRCHGTSLFLKKMYGAGYLIHITKAPGLEAQKQITRVITKTIRSAKLEEVKSDVEVVYLLPLSETPYFPSLFRQLETEGKYLGIISIGVSSTTLEHVFLKVSGEFDKDEEVSTREASSSNLYTDSEKLSGINLFLQQLLFLIYKKILCFTKDLDTLGYRIILPTLVSLAALELLQSITISAPILELSPSLYSGGSVLLQNWIDSNEEITNAFKDYIVKMDMKVKQSYGDNITVGVYKYGRMNFLKLRTDFILAAQFRRSMNDLEGNSNNTKRKSHQYLLAGETSSGDNAVDNSNRYLNILLYNPIAGHSLGVLVNAYSNAFLRESAGGNSYSIKTFNDPVAPTNIAVKFEFLPVLFGLLGWTIALGYFTLDLSTYFIILVLTERLNDFKRIQFLSRVSPIVYWLSNFLFDAILFLTILLIRWWLLRVISNTNFLLYGDDSFGYLMKTWAVYIPSSLVCIYVMSNYARSGPQVDVLFYFLHYGGCIVTFGVGLGQYAMLSKEFDHEFIISNFIHTMLFLIHIYPPLTYFLIYVKISINWFQNNVKTGMKDEKEWNYFVLPSQVSPLGILEDWIFLCVGIFLYTTILLCVDYGVFRKLKQHIISRFYKKYLISDDTPALDPNIINEKEIVTEAFNQDNSSSGFILLVYNLKKYFFSLSSYFIAVHDVTFSVHASECFGLLGINGAGKSTTFKMLVGELAPTKGDASILNYKLSKSTSKYSAQIGYCAQTNCFVEQLSGKQMLNLTAALKGIPLKNKTKLVDDWLTVLGLEAHESRPCGTYSGGNKRKLCTAMALIGNSPVIFLDEPTTGVDPVSRQKLYSVMRESKMAGQAVVLTSHSMEECELLCDRLTIMVGGVMKCMGTSQELKRNYAQGISIQIKLYSASYNEKNQNILKEDMINNFEILYTYLLDEHEGLLDYRITNIFLQWSEAFSRMEALKEKHKFIEDYIIGDTTLEQVFLSFS